MSAIAPLVRPASYRGRELDFFEKVPQSVMMAAHYAWPEEVTNGTFEGPPGMMGNFTDKEIADLKKVWPKKTE